MSLYSYLNRESIVINKLIAFTQAPKFETLMQLLMKSDIITTNERLYSTSQNRLTEITIYDSKITISIYPSVLINEYPYEMVSIAEIELDPKAGTYTLTNIDGRFHNITKSITTSKIMKKICKRNARKEHLCETTLTTSCANAVKNFF